MASDPTAAATGAGHQHPTGARPDMGQSGINDVGDARQPQRHDARPVTSGEAREQLDQHLAPQDGTAQEQADAEPMVTIEIRCPSLERLPSSLTQIYAPASTTIVQLKERLQSTWPGRPAMEALRFFKAGYLLADDAAIASLLDKDGQSNAVILHLVVRPGPWMRDLTRAMQTQGEEAHAIPEVRAQTAQDSSAGSTPTAQPSRSSVRFALPTNDGTQPPLASSSGVTPPLRNASAMAPSSPLQPLGSIPTSTLTSFVDSKLQNSDARQSKESKLLGRLLAETPYEDYGAVRDLLVWTQTHYMGMYEEIWMRAYGDSIASSKERKSSYACDASPERVAKAVALVEDVVLQWGSVEKEVDRKLKDAAAKGVGGARRWDKVDIDGLPYLLQTQVNPCTAGLKILRNRIRNLGELCLRIDHLKLSLGGTAMSMTMRLEASNPLGQELVNLLARTANAPAVHGGGAAGLAGLQDLGARTRAQSGYMRTMGIYMRTLTRQDMFQIAMTSFFLTFKLGILVFVFTRNAPSTRKLVITGLAGIYVLWECQNMIIRSALHRIRETTRQARAQNPGLFPQRPARPPAAPNATGQSGSPGGTARRAPTPRSVPIPVAPLRYRHRSLASIEFWLERLSYYGLEQEDREMGFRTLSSNGQLIAPRQEEQPEPVRYSMAWLSRILQNYVLLPVVLFLVTLVPDLEQRRRRAISKREQLIRSTARKVEALEARLREEQQQQQQQGGSPDTPTDTTVARPLFLRTAYGRRLLANEQSGGPQLDIAAELDAAAALAVGERPGGGGGGPNAPEDDALPNDEADGMPPAEGDMNFL